MTKRLTLLAGVCAVAVLTLTVALAAYALQDQAPQVQGEGMTGVQARYVDLGEHDLPDTQFEIPPATMTELADGVYHYFGFFTSSLVVISGDDVLITDPANPLRAQSLQEEIAKLTDNPVNIIALTHEHFDHVGGTGVFPEARVLCHRNCAPVFALSSLGDVPDQVDEDFDVEMAIGVGDKTVELHYLGPGDGDATTIVYMPEERIIATADLYEPRALTHKNWVDDKNFTGVRHILNEISTWPMTHAINAHSPGTDPQDMMENVQYYNDLFDAVKAAYAGAIAEGGIFAGFTVLQSLPQTLELPKYQDWTNYDTSFPRHVERMFQAITHGD